LLELSKESLSIQVNSIKVVIKGKAPKNEKIYFSNLVSYHNSNFLKKLDREERLPFKNIRELAIFLVNC